MASNVQAGTRGLSAGDWIRLKRLQGARNYQSDSVTNPSPLLLETTQGARRVFTEFGTSKIRRPASFWTDYRASQTADYVLESQDSQTKSRSLTATKLCCLTTETVSAYQVSGFITSTIETIVAPTFDGSVGSVVYYSGLSAEGMIIKNGTRLYLVYVDTTTYPGYPQISVSLTPGGGPINLDADGIPGDGYLNVVTSTSINQPTSSAIKHNPTCITCKHEKRTNLQPLAKQPSCVSCGS
jgi:hypothetical protein